MLFFPIALPLFVLLIIFIPIALILIFLNVGFAVFEVLGFPPVVSILIFIGIIIGSAINIPVHEFMTKREPLISEANVETGVPYRIQWMERRSVIAINVGGAIIPMAISIYFLTSLPLGILLFTTCFVSLTAYITARPVSGWGVTVPLLIPALATIAISYSALYFSGASLLHLARLGFASGVFGVIIGADLLNLPAMKKSGAPLMSIGGGGTFDGIFLTAIFSTIAAALLVGGRM